MNLATFAANLEAFVTILERLAMNLETFVTNVQTFAANLEAFVTILERLAMNVGAFVAKLAAA